MAEEIYDREMRMRRAIQLLQGSLLVIAVGVAWGLTPSLSRIASGAGANPLGLALWVNLMAAAVCLSIAVYRGRLPRLGWRELMFFLIRAFIAGILQRLTTFWVTAHVEAAMLSLIVTLQGFMVFVFAAATQLEKATPRRLLGLFVGLAGVGGVLVTNYGVTAGEQNVWLLIAMVLPFLFALEAIFLAARRPVHNDIFASVGLMMLFSSMLLFSLAYQTGQRMIPVWEVSRLQLVAV